MDIYRNAFVGNKHKAAKVINVSKHSWRELINRFIPANLNERDKFHKTFYDYYTEYYASILIVDSYENNNISLTETLKIWRLCDYSPVFIYFLYKKGYRNIKDLKHNVNAVIRAMNEENDFNFELLKQLIPDVCLIMHKLVENHVHTILPSHWFNSNTITSENIKLLMKIVNDPNLFIENYNHLLPSSIITIKFINYFNIIHPKLQWTEKDLFKSNIFNWLNSQFGGCVMENLDNKTYQEELCKYTFHNDKYTTDIIVSLCKKYKDEIYKLAKI